MKQPELGKKIAELRKAKSLTQEELIVKCKLNVRTLQRIESGLVTPRSYTLKTIFAALEFTINDSSESDFKRRVSPFIQGKIKQIYKYIIELFNLKTDTMKKLSILSTATIVLVLGLMTFCTESKAQKSNESKYIKSNGKGIIYLFPRNLRWYVSNKKDTADYKMGDYLVQEYKYKLFLNKEFVGNAHIGDTVILDQGKIEIRRPFFWEFRSQNGNGIVYIIPKDLKMNYAANRDTDNMFVGGSRIREFDNKIFLNGEYFGTANTGDSVIFKKGSFLSKSSLVIKKALRLELKFRLSELMINAFFKIRMIIRHEVGF